MRANWDGCCTLYLRTEGGYVNNPNDRGGPTNKGCTLATCRSVISPTFTIAQLKALSVAQASAIFKDQYWDKVGGDSLASGVDYTMGDYAINSGASRPVRVLQALLDLPQTGRMTDAVLKAAAEYEEADIIKELCAERLRFMKGLATWPHFGAGWSNRVNGVQAHALAMAAHAVKDGAPSLYAAQYIDMAAQLPTGKAYPGKAGASPEANATAGAGAGIAAIAGAYHVGGYVAMGATFVGVGIVAAGIVALQSKLNASANAPVGVAPLKKA